MKKVLVFIVVTAALLLSFSHRAFSNPISYTLKGQITSFDISSPIIDHGYDIHSLFKTSGVGDDVIFSYVWGYDVSWDPDPWFKYSLSFGNITIMNEGPAGNDPGLAATFGFDNPYFTGVPWFKNNVWVDPWGLTGTITDYTNVIGVQDMTVVFTTTDSIYGVNIGFSATQPIPEPATAILLGGGLLGLYRCRKKFSK